ncbi:type II toxin-antitoxin system RelE/ParE family toxin [Methylosinus sp. RM1]|uniref:type II toxin-antitoxin system RelE/ParE family toxin n=1 Tax=Methylosinus sp. RM1 TaxID=2583817 RepID=UPI001409EF40|nr:type II toxin-antitoxin system RelE/ParE family toxin [Methylosinus sp. RM1]
MRLRYTARAAQHIDAVLAFVAERSPRGARNIRIRLQTVLALLQERPLAGRRTSVPPVRRISASPYPYLVDYQANGVEIVILRFRHAARSPIG